MKYIYIALTMLAGAVAAITITGKEELSSTGQVWTNSSEIEAVWYPE